MSWLIDERQVGEKKQYRIYSTVVDKYLFPWLDKEEVIEIIINNWQMNIEGDIKDLKQTFPAGWSNRDHKIYEES